MTAANYPASLAFTLKYEGGRVDNPKDPGGRTNQGVTQKTYDAWRGKKGLSRKDVYEMAASERDEIYKIGYWDTVGGDAIPAGPDLATFDYGVNSGPSRGKAAYTAARAASADPATIAKAICARRMSFLRGLGTFKTFGKGWTTRVAACEALAVKMALAATGKPVAQGLAVEADKARQTATKQTGAAIGAGTLGPVTTVADQANSNPSGIWIWVALAVLLGSAFILFLKSRNNEVRAVAYEDAAREEQP